MASVPDPIGTAHVEVHVGNPEEFAAEVEEIVTKACKTAMQRGLSSFAADMGGKRRQRPTVVDADGGDLETR